MASPLPAYLTLEACPHPFHRQIICCQPDWSPETGYSPPKHVTHTYLRHTHAHICHTHTICILHISKDPFTPHTFQHTHSHIHATHTSPAHISKTFPYTHKHSFMLTCTFISIHPYSQTCIFPHAYHTHTYSHILPQSPPLHTYFTYKHPFIIKQVHICKYSLIILSHISTAFTQIPFHTDTHALAYVHPLHKLHS